ncbi:MAG TPA: 50S ribosomal protein L25/general stress protein Ctc [Actinomycetota bacterium]|nr:50S ribosomal protein L25/general stress protein Ctc [Actinomycetota bacterium]
MAEVRLRAEKRRGTGKGVARKARAAGKVPGVVYGRGMEPIAIQVDRRDLALALHTEAGMNVLLDLEMDGDTTLALTRELQRDPVRGTLLHADFVAVDRTQAIDVEVPIQLVGEAPGVTEGGVLEHGLFTLHVRCLPGDVPERVDADVSALGIGDSLKVGDVRVAGDYAILNDPEAVVALVAAPVSEEELEAMQAAVSGDVEQVAAAEEEAAEAAPEPEGGEEAGAAS